MAEIKGIAPGTRLRRGQFFRATWILPNRWSWIYPASAELEVFSNTYERITKAGLAIPVSELEVTAGDKSMVVDLLLWPAADGLTVAYVARELDAMTVSLSLSEFELIDRNQVKDAGARAATKQLANAAVDSKNLFKKLDGQFKYLKWVLVLIVLAGLLYAGSRVVGELKR